MSSNASTADDHGARLRRLRRARQRATLVLVLVSGVFVVGTVWRGSRGAWGYLQAGAEAAMVGGIADWFAVTALFRRPLGLPIPHTAVVVERKDQFGESLGRFVQENFLNGAVLSERLRSADVPGRLARWLIQPERAAKAASRAVDLAVEVAELLAEDSVSETLAGDLGRALDAVPTAALAGRALRVAATGGRYAAVFDSGVAAVDRFLDRNRDSLRMLFRQEAPRWVPDLVDDALFDRLLRRLRRRLHAMVEDPDHRYRGELKAWLEELIVQLETSPDLARRAEELKSTLLSQAELREWSQAVWTELKGMLRDQAADPGSELRQRLASALAKAGSRLQSDPSLRDSVQRAAEVLAASVADSYQEDLAALVTATIGRWDARETSDRLELLLGPDLQFIRLNGTLVGGLVGVALHALATVL